MPVLDGRRATPGPAPSRESPGLRAPLPVPPSPEPLSPPAARLVALTTALTELHVCISNRHHLYTTSSGHEAKQETPHRIHGGPQTLAVKNKVRAVPPPLLGRPLPHYPSPIVVSFPRVSSRDSIAVAGSGRFSSRRRCRWLLRWRLRARVRSSSTPPLPLPPSLPSPVLDCLTGAYPCRL